MDSLASARSGLRTWCRFPWRCPSAIWTRSGRPWWRTGVCDGSAFWRARKMSALVESEGSQRVLMERCWMVLIFSTFFGQIYSLDMPWVIRRILSIGIGIYIYIWNYVFPNIRFGICEFSYFARMRWSRGGPNSRGFDWKNDPFSTMVWWYGLGRHLKQRNADKTHHPTDGLKNMWLELGWRVNEFLGVTS